VRRFAALLLVPFVFVPTLLVAGCGDDKGDSRLPEVSGKFGEKPTVKLPKGEASKELLAETLVEGSGPEVKKGQLLVAHYLGEIFRDGKVFDNSYDRKSPLGFQIGVRKVIAGWDEKLVGVKAGSRVVLSIPPDKGYGEQGQSQAGIKGDDTLVFVVDVLGSYDTTAGADGKPVPAATDAKLPAVKGAPGKEPQVTVPKGAPAPKQVVTKTLLQGDGAVVRKGQAVVQQYLATSWSTGKTLDNTWKREGAPLPVTAPVDAQQLLPGWAEALEGVKVGSRIMTVLPPEKAFGKAGKSDVGVKPNETIVLVIDVLGVH
jgi:peptidylprolyl isomerase